MSREDRGQFGTELTSVEQHTAEWTRLTAAVRAHYRGPLSRSVNYNRLSPKPPRVPGTALGVDAYCPRA